MQSSRRLIEVSDEAKRLKGFETAGGRSVCGRFLGNWDLKKIDLILSGSAVLPFFEPSDHPHDPHLSRFPGRP
jgi:hypothetical protein